MYAFNRHAAWARKYSIKIDQYFDPLRIKVLHVLTRCLEQHLTHYSLNDMQLQIESQLQILTKNPNAMLAFAAWECLSQFLIRAQEPNNPDFQRTMREKLDNVLTQKEALKILVAAVQRQKANSPNCISSGLLNTLCSVLMNTQDSDIKTWIIFIIAKLLDNDCNLHVIFPAMPLPQNVVTIIIDEAVNNHHDETASLALRYLAKNVMHRSELATNMDTLTNQLERLGNILLTDDYSDAVKNNLIELLFNIVTYKIENHGKMAFDTEKLFHILLNLLKKNRLVLATIKILNQFAIKTGLISHDIFEELVSKLSHEKPEVIGNIQVLFRNYIQHRTIDKLPHSTIILLAKALHHEKGFMHVRPILNYLIFVGKYYENIPLDAIQSFLEIASSDQEEIASFGGELVFQCRASLLFYLQNEDSVIAWMDNIKKALDRTRQNGMMKTSILLLRTIFDTKIFPLDVALKNTIVSFVQQSTLSGQDCEMMYHYLAKQDPIHLTDPVLIEKATRDLHLSESLALASMLFFGTVLPHHLDEMLLKKIMFNLSQATQRPSLIEPILKTLLSARRRKAFIVDYFPKPLCDLCLSLQYAVKDTVKNKDIAFDLLEYMHQALAQLMIDEDDKALIKRIYTHEKQAKLLLSSSDNLSQSAVRFVKEIQNSAREGQLIGLITQRYLIDSFKYEPLKNSPHTVDVFVSMAKNGQILLPKIVPIVKRYLELNWNVVQVLHLINVSINAGCVLEETLFETIQKTSTVFQNTCYVMPLLKIFEIQVRHGKTLLPKTMWRLKDWIMRGDVEQKKMAASVLYFCRNTDKDNAFLFSKSVDDRQQICSVLLDLIISHDDEQSLHWMALYKKTALIVHDDIALYFLFKEKIILKAELDEIKIVLYAIRDLREKDFFQQPHIQANLIENIQQRIIDSSTQGSVAGDCVDTLVALLALYPQYQLPSSIIEKCHLVTLTQSGINYLKQMLNLLKIVLSRSVTEKKAQVNCADLLKYIIRYTFEAPEKPKMRQRALDLFKLVNMSLKEYYFYDDDQLLDAIQNVNASLLSDDAKWLSQQLEYASEHKISAKHEYYRKKIDFIVEQAEKMQIDCKVLEKYLVQPFSQMEWENLVKIFELCPDDEAIDRYGWKISFLMRELFIQSNEPASPLHHSPTSIAELLHLCETAVIFHAWKPQNNDFFQDKSSIAFIITLLRQQWHREHLIVIGENLKQRCIGINFLDFFEQLCRYQIQPEHSDAIIELTKNVSGNFIQALHQFFIKTYFFKNNSEQAQEKLVIQLVDEFCTMNGENNPDKRQVLQHFLQEISESNPDKMLEEIPDMKTLREWTESQFQAWVTHRDLNYFNNPKNLAEILIIINQAVILFTSRLPRFKAADLPGFGIRSSQYLVIKCFLEGSTHRLGQLATGEGKSIVIAVIALIKVLQGHKGDVVVSSPLFAENDAASIKAFFAIFNKTVAHNNHQNTERRTTEKPLPCYTADVVYGDISQFQFDWLNQDFKQLTTRGDRKLDWVIVDEADNVLLDCATNVAKLAEYLPAFDCLEFIYIMMWSRLGVLFKEHNDNREMLREQLLITMKAVIHTSLPMDVQREKSRFESLRSRMVHGIGVSSETDQSKEKPIHEKVSNEMILFPQHLQRFIASQMDIWIDNAIFVFFDLKKDRDYVIRKDEENIERVVLVDYTNTGVTLLNTQWSDGIHQFLQLKEGVKLVPETLTTNYLSNYSFLRRYQQLIGLTGTLGNDKTRLLLSRLYRHHDNTPLECFRFPSYKAQRLHLYAPQAVANERVWKQKIQQSVKHQVTLGRAVLIICESIYELNSVQKALNEENAHYKIKIFKRSDEEIFEGNETTLDSRQIFLTTNLGGRGVDLKVSRPIVEQGGLHVIVTFLSASQRVFDQAIGRTARNGNPGTAEQIVNIAGFFGNETRLAQLSFEQLADYRDSQEEKRFETLENELKINEIKDKLFDEFCDFLKKMIKKWKPENSQYQKFKDWAYAYLNEFQKDALTFALIERWGLWLKDMEKLLSQGKENEITKQFEAFLAEMTRDELSGNLIQNPCYLLQQNNRILGYLQSWKHALFELKGYSESCHKILMDNADKVHDSLFIAQAHAMKAYALLTKRGENTNAQACEYFEQAVKSIQEETLPPLLMQQQLLTQIDPRHRDGVSSIFCDQITDKISILSTFLRVYEESVLQTRRARKLIDLTINSENHPQCTQVACLEKLAEAAPLSRITLRFHDLRIVYDMNRFLRDEPLQLLARFQHYQLMREPYPMILFESYSTPFYSDLLRTIDKAAKKEKALESLEIEIKRLQPSKQITVERITAETIQEALTQHEPIVSIVIPIKHYATMKMFIEKFFYLEIEDAVIEVSSLSHSQATDILKGLSLIEEDFQRTSLREISTVFSSPKQYPDVHQFMANGFYYLFELKERRPLQVYTMATLMTIASTEILLGAVLFAVAIPTVFGAGVSVGLIADGISEALEIIRVDVTRKHHWMHYGVQKAASLSLILITAGVSHAVAMSATKANATVNAGAQGFDVMGDAVKISVGRNATVVSKKEVTAMILKVVSADVMKKALTGMAEQFSPYIYAELTKKIQRKVDEALHLAMREHAIVVKKVFACASLLGVVDLEKRLGAEIAMRIKTNLHKDSHETFLEQFRSMQLLRESKLIDAIYDATRSAFVHILDQESTLIHMKKVITYFFEQKNLDLETIQKNTDIMVRIFSSDKNRMIDPSNFSILEQPSPTIDWLSCPASISTEHREELVTLYRQAHQQIYHTTYLDDPNRLNTKALRDALYQVITQMLLAEIIGVVCRLESVATSTLVSSLEFAFAPSKIFDPSSLSELETLCSVGKLCDPRRLSGTANSSASSLSKWMANTFSSQKYRHYHESRQQERRKFDASITSMQALNEEKQSEHQSVSQGFTLTQPLQESAHNMQVLGVPAAEPSPTEVLSQLVHEQHIISQFFDLMAQDHEAIRLMMTNNNPSITTFIERFSSQIVFSNRLFYLLIQNFCHFYGIATAQENDHPPEQALAAYLTLASSDKVWEELLRHADQIPNLYDQLKMKWQLFENWIPSGYFVPIQKNVFQWVPDEFFREFLTVIKLAIQSPEAVKQFKILLGPQSTQAIRIHALFDALSVTIPQDENKSFATALIQCVNTHLIDVLYETLMKTVEKFLWIIPRDRVEPVIRLALALFSSSEIPNLYQHLKPAIVVYGNSPSLLAPMLLARLLYENKSFHQHLSRYLFNEDIYEHVFYNINLALIAYNQSEHFSVGLSLFRIFNQVTRYYPTAVILGAIALLSGILFKKSPWQLVANALAFPWLITAFLRAIDGNFINKKQDINQLYSRKGRSLFFNAAAQREAQPTAKLVKNN